MYGYKKNIFDKYFALEKKKSILSISLLGGCSALAFAPTFLYFLLFICIPIFYHLIKKSKSIRQALKVGFYFGLGHFTVGLYWISNSLLIDIMQFWFLIPFSLLGLPIVLSTLYMAPLAVITYLTKLNGIIGAMVFASYWVIIEWLRGFLFSGFPWNLIGYSLGFSDELLQIASVFGVYGLSYVVVITTLMPYFIYKNMDKYGRFFIITILIYVTLFIGGYVTIKYSVLENISEINLRLVQANIKQDDRWHNNQRYNNLRKHISLSQSANNVIPDIVIWPEAAIDFYVDINEPILFLKDIIKDNALLITGVERVQKQGDEYVKNWNSSIVVNQQGKILEYYDKKHLVPFGEYVPFREVLSFNKITNGFRDITPGDKSKVIKLNNNVPAFSPIICYEAIFPEKVLIKKHLKSKWILNLTNDAWYGDSSGPYQHLQIARIRAIENGMPLIRSTSTGISAVIDSFGRVKASLALNTEGILDYKLPKPKLSITIYRQYGDIPFLIFAVIIVLVGFYSRKCR